MEILVGRLNGIMDMKIFYRGKTTGNCVSVQMIFPARSTGPQATKPSQLTFPEPEYSLTPAGFEALGYSS